MTALAGTQHNPVTIVNSGANPVTLINTNTLVSPGATVPVTTEYQAGLDSSEGSTLFLKNGTYLLDGTTYYGNVHILGESRDGVIIKVVMDGSWSALGTGANNTLAAFLGKTNAGAGYGFTSFNAIFENLTVEYTFGTVGATNSVLMYFGYWQGGGFRNVTLKAVSGLNTAKALTVELYEGCKDLYSENLLIDNTDNAVTTATEGGALYIRGRNGQDSYNIVWSQCQFLNNNKDEIIAIWTTTGHTGDLYQHGFYDCYLEQQDECTNGIRIRNDNSDPLSGYQARIDGMRIVVKDTKSGGINDGIRIEDIQAYISNTVVVVEGVSVDTTDYYAFYGRANALSPTPRSKLDNCQVFVTGAMLADVVTGFAGDLDLYNCSTKSEGSGDIETCLLNITGSVVGGEFMGTDNVVADNCNRITGAVLHGEVVDCYNLDDVTIELDTNTFVTSTVLTNTANAKSILKWNNVTINVSGTGTVSRPYLINAATHVKINGLFVSGDATNMASITPGTLNATATLSAKEMKNVMYYNGTTYTQFQDGFVTFQTGNGDLLPGPKGVEFRSSTARAATIADFADHEGIFSIRCATAPGAGSHTVTLTSGTFNGTNNVASLNATTDHLIVSVDSSGTGTVIANNGVVLS